ncbi:adenine-specific DNA-methyltransferase [endosymbiont of unidentified scaly snail isolate Monju]|nr:50S ribosomal protein L3 N(5)-glutamine methyltransferase [endosymbiont of unidentified scaly snail isolate Monju]BAN68967.1 adenine-specific DNA-methyltransferase [endosymbiont of unidentified scaly snail isolate Monju]
MTTLEIPLDELHSLRDWVRWSASTFEAHGLFFGHGTDNALDEALELVLATLHLDHSLPESFLDARVTRAEAAELARRLRRRVEDRVPLAHITGRAFFAGLVFEVNEHVLVPRSPIAELIEARFEPWLDAEHVRSVLDLCTGSGCIGIACAHAFPEALVDLADISPEALEVAQRNTERHGVADRVRVVQSDVYAGLDGKRYDLIVSNPPYVSEAEMATLPPEYHREPRLGLAAGEDGMKVVARILAEAPEHLNEGGILVCEVGASADLLMARYPDVPFLWLDFERGGDGVFLLTAGQLAEFHDVFVEG